MSLELNRVASGLPKPPDKSVADCRRVPEQSGNRGTTIRTLAACAFNGHHLIRSECLIETAGARRRSLVPLPPFWLGLPENGTPYPILMLGDECASWQRVEVRERHLQPIPAGCPASMVRGRSSLAQYGPTDAGHPRREASGHARRFGRLIALTTSCPPKTGA